MGSRVRTRVLTLFHFISSFENSKSGGDELGKWVAGGIQLTFNGEGSYDIFKTIFRNPDAVLV